MGLKHPFLYASLFFTENPHWIYQKPVELLEKGIFSCKFKFQHTHGLVDCEICETKKGLVVRLLKPKRALTEGQYAVFYKSNECLGGARITKIGTNDFIYKLKNHKMYVMSDLFDNFTVTKIAISN